MIQSYLIGPTTLASNSSPVAFERDCIRTGDCNNCNGWLCHSEGSPVYKITKGGRYRITFNANATAGGTGYVALGLLVDGVQVGSAIASASIVTGGLYYNIAFDKVITVCCNANSTITIASIPSVIEGTTPTPTATAVPTIQNANLIITRLS